MTMASDGKKHTFLRQHRQVEPIKNSGKHWDSKKDKGNFKTSGEIIKQPLSCEASILDTAGETTDGGTLSPLSHDRRNASPRMRYKCWVHGTYPLSAHQRVTFCAS